MRTLGFRSHGLGPLVNGKRARCDLDGRRGLRIGGLVKEGSVVRADGKAMTFAVTDLKKEIRVSYTGQVPDLFREGQGVVAEGVLVGPAELRADSVLAKHDEKYMPREVADALKKQGVWNEGDPGGPPAPATGKP